MKIILTPPPPPVPTTYTGDPRDWPDGLYSGDNTIDYLLVYESFVVVLCEVWAGLEGVDRTRQRWTRIPGYTGGIASIEPERETLP